MASNTPVDQVAHVFACALAAKVLLESSFNPIGFMVRRIHRLRLFFGLGVALLGVSFIHPFWVLWAAILVRFAQIVFQRGIAVINHSFLEGVILLIVARLGAQPAALVAALQTAIVSVWIYSVGQKLYHRQFLNGNFFLSAMVDKPALLRLSRFLSGRRLPPLPRVGFFSRETFPAHRHYAIQLARLALAGEFIVPFLALAFSGTPWAMLLMLLLALSSGLLSGEISFMVTNLLFAPLFLLPFQHEALAAAAGDGLVALLLIWLLAWPPLHAWLARRLAFSPWRLFGWGMYATIEPRLLLVTPDGKVAELPAVRPSSPKQVFFGLLFTVGFGACRLPAVRAYAWSQLFRAYETRALAGAVLAWRRVEGSGFISECLVQARDPRASSRCFQVRDAATQADFERACAELRIT